MHLHLVAILASVTGIAATYLDLVSLASVDANAVCNDGSPAGYYWQAGSDGSTTWIVSLEGGGWCTDETECKKRCPPGHMEDHRLCSSSPWNSTTETSGLMQPASNPTLAAANKAYVAYCSSDAHMGNASAFGMQFRGAVIVEAVLKEMVKRGMGQGGEQHTLIFAGQSAGGRGAMVHLDYIADMLGPIASKNVEVVGLLDSPLYLDIPPYPMSGFKGFAAECQGVYSFAGVKNVGDACMAAHPTEAWKCIMGQYRVPQIRTPFLLVAAEFDEYQLGRNEIYNRPGGDQLRYAEDFANRTRALMNSIRRSWPAHATRQNAVYSRACWEHATSLTHAGYDESVTITSHATMDTAMTQFLQRTGELEWIDDCEGFACGGSNCHGKSDVFFRTVGTSGGRIISV